MTFNDFFPVLAQLAFDHFLHQIDGNIHIIAYLFRADDIALNRDCNLNFLAAAFLHTHCHRNFRIRIKVAFQFSKLFRHCIPKSVAYLKVFSSDLKSHKLNPFT